MSRSYKKNPIIKENGKSKKVGKTIANSHLRSYIKQNPENIPQNMQYKKVYDRWNFCDWCTRCSKREWEQYYYDRKAPHYWKFRRPGEEESLQESMNYWNKIYRRK